ncbi:MAG: hypothetical protein IRZ07_19465, partial [Microbispora sp.]|nr:hypothetical protein [Microbispora sp.]
PARGARGRAPAPGGAPGPAAAAGQAPASGTAFDPLSSPSGSTHAPERSKEAMWPTPSPGDMPGDVGGTPEPAHRTGQHAMPRPAAAPSTPPQATGSAPDADAADRPQAGRRRRGERADALNDGDGRSKLLLAVAVIAVIAVIVTIVLVLMPSGPDDNEASAAGPAATGTAAGAGSGATPTERRLPSVPDGYHLVTENGASLAVPDNWSTRVDNGVIRLTGPKDSGQSITIKRIPDGSLAALREAEQNLDIRDFTDYTQVRLGKVDYRYPAAEWEYTYTNSSEVTVHAVIRYLETGGRAYAIMFASPDYDWNESAARVRQTLWTTFRPV